MARGLDVRLYPCSSTRDLLKAMALPLRHVGAQGAKFVGILGLVLVMGCSESKSKIYSSDPMESWIVDADTGAPLEGVNVVIGWEALGGLEGGSTVGWVKVMEAVTDAKGRFAFDGWGPVEWKKPGALQGGSPTLILFKDGYQITFLVQQTRERSGMAPAHMRSDYDKKTIKLARFRESTNEYARHVARLDTKIDALLSTDECNFKYIPRFLAAVEQVNVKFVEQQMIWYARPLAYLSSSYSKKCGDLRAFVLEHGR